MVAHLVDQHLSSCVAAREQQVVVDVVGTLRVLLRLEELAV